MPSELINLFLRKDRCNVALIGPRPDELNFAEKVLAEVDIPENVAKLVRRLSFQELPSLLAEAALFPRQQ